MQTADKAGNLETATLAGGCFWCLEAVFDDLDGVHSVESGYMGGHLAKPTYQQVCAGDSGHAEVVQLRFDPQAVSFDDILAVFFTVHDPTTLNRQGNDVGTQYRSAVFYHSAEQKSAAERAIEQITRAGLYRGRIVTEIAPAAEFFPAEDYHQEYFARNPYQPYCQAIVAPKVAKFRKHFLDRLKKKTAAR